MIQIYSPWLGVALRNQHRMAVANDTTWVSLNNTFVVQVAHGNVCTFACGERSTQYMGARPT